MRNCNSLFGLLCMLTMQSCSLPDTVTTVPSEQVGLKKSVRSRADVVFTGTYRTGRTPCEWLPDGTRRWGRTAGFSVENVNRGHVKVPYVEVRLNSFVEEPLLQLEEGRRYIVSLDTNNSLRSRLSQSEAIGFQEALGDDIVISIVSPEGNILYSQENKAVETDR